MAKLLSGKPVAEHITQDLRARIGRLAKENITPTLALLRVGSHEEDIRYEKATVARAEKLGIATVCRVLEASATEQEILSTVEAINEDDAFHGCLLFRPLPKGTDERRICNALAPRKDIDGISETSLASVFTDGSTGFAPSTAVACMKVLDFYDIPLEGRRAVVVGRSLVVGKPLALMLLRRNATVTICHSRTTCLSETMRGADIVVCATGRARAFGKDCFFANQVVLDVGINFDDTGTLCGDVDFDAVEPVVGALTPVPGGIGAVTTNTTLEHVVEAAERAAAC